MTALWTFLKCLPELLALVKTLIEAGQESETKRKVQDDLKTIHGAFVEKDSSKLNALFNSK